MTLPDDNSREVLSPELKRFYDWAIGEISNSGAGLCDMPRNAEIHQALCTALGFSAEDVAMIRAMAELGERQSIDRASMPYALSDYQRRAIEEQGRVGADKLRSLASRIAALLPPSP